MDIWIDDGWTYGLIWMDIWIDDGWTYGLMIDGCMD